MHFVWGAVVLLAVLRWRARMVRRATGPEFGPIPRVIHQTWESWDDVPPPCRPVIARNLANNPEWEYRFHDAAARRELVRSRFDERTLRAFDKLPTPTLKADMFRLCCLFVHGGLYMDIKTSVGQLESLTPSGKLVYCRWPYGIGRLDHSMHAATSVLMWPPRHWVLKKVIDRMIYRIEKLSPRRITRMITWVTGPNLYASVVCAHVPKRWMLYSEDYFGGLFEHDGTGGLYYEYVRQRGLHWHQQVA